ncbi:MAG TPA: DMT family transporter [Rhodocyclaceae bacterium]|nr:DMT family transporter [Rhodocyclaceae bacterium]
MINTELHGVVYGLLAMIGWGIGNSITRTSAIAIGVVPTLFYRNLVVVISLAIAVLALDLKVVFDWQMVSMTCALSVLGYISLLSLFKAQKTGKLGLISPISGAGSAAITVAYAIIFYRDQPSGMQQLGIGLVLLGVVCVSLNLKDLRNSNLFSRGSGVPYAILTALCWGIMFALMVKPSLAIGAVFCALVLNICSLLLSSAHIAISKTRLVVPKLRIWVVLLVVGLFSALGIVGYNIGVTAAPVSIVYTIAAAAPIVGILAGLWIYKEIHPPHHYLGMLASILGIVLIGLGK